MLKQSCCAPRTISAARERCTLTRASSTRGMLTQAATPYRANGCEYQQAKRWQSRHRPYGKVDTVLLYDIFVFILVQYA